MPEHPGYATNPLHNRIPQFNPPAPKEGPRYDKRREAWKFYKSSRWLNVKNLHLVANPLCEDCQAQGRVTPATEVHHKIKRLVRPDLAFEPTNLQSLCKRCHQTRPASRR